MAIFKKPEPQPQKPRERPLTTSRNQGDAAISIIGSGMKVVGDISTEGIVRVEGQVRGTIRAGTAVVLGQAGAIEGNVYTEDAVIGGRVSGSIVAANRLELQSTCSVDGEIRTRAEHLKLEEGARFAGQVQMIEEEQPRQAVEQLQSADGSPVIAAVHDDSSSGENNDAEVIRLGSDEEEDADDEEEERERKKA